MIPTPYRFEPKFTPDEFMKLGQFACRWAHIEHTIGNCLRRLLDMEPSPANIMVFPLSLDMRMRRIDDMTEIKPLRTDQNALFLELKPLVLAMQWIRNTALHGIVIAHDDGDPDHAAFYLRSKGRDLRKKDLLSCEDLINYTALVVRAFRLSLGEKEDDRGHSYTLPDRPSIPDFLPPDCRVFPKASTGGPLVRP